MRPVNNKTTWAKTLLKRLGVPESHGAVKGLIAWADAEGGHWGNPDRYNPLNTTYSLPGAVSTNSAGVKRYQSWNQGFNATIKTLRLPAYTGVVRALHQGDAHALAGAVGSSSWGTSTAGILAMLPGAKVGHGYVAGGGGGGGGRGGGPSRGNYSGGGGAGGGLMQQPAPDFTGMRQSLLLNYVDQQNNPDALLNLALGMRSIVDQQQQQPSLGFTGGGRPRGGGGGGGGGGRRPAGGYHVGSNRVVTTSYGGVTAKVPVQTRIPNVTHPHQIKQLKGAVLFEGKPVAAWIAPVLRYAKHHGWSGTVSEGIRTDGQQTAIYRSGLRPAALPRSMGGGGSNHEFKAFPGGAVDVSGAEQLSAILQRSPYRHLLVWAASKDPVHFSHPHNGAY